MLTVLHIRLFLMLYDSGGMSLRDLIIDLMLRVLGSIPNS